MHGLTSQDIILQEDSAVVPLTEVEELTSGVQFVIAISPGSSFTIRDSMGISRYEYFLQGFFTGSWIDQDQGVDDFSLLTLGGPQLVHISDLAKVKSLLESYAPPEQESEPGLEILASALQVASDPTPRAGMERAILFITPPQATDITLGLQSIIATANQQNIHVYVWMLAAPEVFESPEISQMRTLADQTQGTFWGFSHDEPVPDLESLIEPLRNVYQLGYDSQITTPGLHQVSVQVAIGEQMVTSQPQTFELNLQPPAVTLLDTPSEIVRTYSVQPTQTITELNGRLLPEDQILKLKVSFTDGYDRPVVQTRLYVDGSLVGENTNPPLDQFLWDIRPYTQDGEHTLLVEAVDSLGLVGKTTETRVKINVPPTTQGLIMAVSHKQPLIAGAAIVVVSSLLVLFLIVGGHIRPKPHPGQPKPVKGSEQITRPSANRQPAAEQNKSFIQAQAVPSNGRSAPVSTTTRRWWQRLPWVKLKEEPVLVKAYLIPLVGSDEPSLPGPLQILADEVSMGSDPDQAALVISDASIDGVHASIRHDGDSYIITDAGTVAGTWVNYEQVSPAGATLHHMDIIHLGRIGFRFRLSEPGQLPNIIVTPLENKGHHE